MPDGSFEELVKAAGLATLLWGGLYCPIIPVSSDEKAAQRLIDLFNVDILFPLIESPEIDRIVAANQFLSQMRPSNMGLLYTEWQSPKQYFAYLDVLHAINLCWFKQVKDMLPDDVSHVRLMHWDQADLLANLFALMFGFFPSDYDLTIDFARAFREGLKGDEQTISAGDILNEGLIHNVRPIDFTGWNIESRGYRWDSGVYVGDPASFDDLIAFWNLRAAGAALEFYPLGHEGRFEAFIDAFAAVLKASPPGPMLPQKFGIHYRPDNEESAKALAIKLVTQRAKVLSRVDSTTWNGLNVKPSSLAFDDQRVLADVDRKFTRIAVTVPLPPKRFLIEDGDQHPHTREQHLVASVHPLTEFDYPAHTLRPPLIRRLNEFYGREAAFNPWELRCENEGLAAVIDAADSNVRLFPIERVRIVQNIFRLIGIQASPSLPGKIASRIIEKLGTESAEPGRVFKIRGVRKLLTDTPASKGITFEKALGTIGSEGFTKFKNLHFARQKGNELRPDDVFNVLLEKRIFTPHVKRSYATQKKKFSCPACGLSSLVKLRLFQSSWSCPFCDFELYLPTVLRETFSASELKKMWGFKRSGLFAKDNNQEGFVPVLLALMWLNAALHNGDVCYTTALDLGGQAEIDFSILKYKYGDEIELGLGEAKATFSRITEEQIEPLKAMWHKTQSLGIHCYLIFAKTTDAFDSSEIELFKRLKEQWIPVILLSNRELESYDVYLEHDDSLPVRHPFTLSDMFRNTVSRYLS